MRELVVGLLEKLPLTSDDDLSPLLSRRVRLRVERALTAPLSSSSTVLTTPAAADAAAAAAAAEVAASSSADRLPSRVVRRAVRDAVVDVDCGDAELSARGRTRRLRSLDAPAVVVVVVVVVVVAKRAAERLSDDGDASDCDSDDGCVSGDATPALDASAAVAVAAESD